MLLCALLGVAWLSVCGSVGFSQVDYATGDGAAMQTDASSGSLCVSTIRTWRPVRGNRFSIDTASAEIEVIPPPQGSEAVAPPPGQVFEQTPPEAVPPDITPTLDFDGNTLEPGMAYGPVEGDFCDYMGSYGYYGGGPGYYGCPGPLCSFYGWIRSAPWGYWLRNFEFFFGAHGFKGPFDLGRNGNFGFHEGINFGAPLGDPWGVGYQLGVQGVHSNFSGDRVWAIREGDRNQVFFTGGIFRRARRQGWQWGVVFDLLRDSYYEKATLGQIRTETSWVTGYGWDIGFWGSVRNERR